MSTSEPRYNELIQLVAPNGMRIVGTLEHVTGRSNVLGFYRTTDGALTPAYTGYTDMFWDDQVTARTSEQQIVVLDAGGNEWPLDRCQASYNA